MKLLEEKVYRFSNFYPDGAFYVLQEKDIQNYFEGIKTGKYNYKNLQYVYIDYAKNKKMYLIPNREYYVLSKKDFLETIPREIINNNINYIRVLFLFKSLNYNCYKRGIEFRKETVLTILSDDISERILVKDNPDFDNINYSKIEKHDYLNTYINNTSFFKLFDRIDILAYNKLYYLKCVIGKYTILLRPDEYKELFLRYQSPDLDDFSLKNLESSIVKVQKEEPSEAVKEKRQTLGDVSKALANTLKARKKPEEGAEEKSKENVEAETIEENTSYYNSEPQEAFPPELAGMPSFGIDLDEAMDEPDEDDFGNMPEITDEEDIDYT